MSQRATEPLLLSLPDGFHLLGFLNTGLAKRLIDEVGAAGLFLVPPGALGHVPEELRAATSWVEAPTFGLNCVGKACRNLRVEATHAGRAGSDWEIIRRKHARGLIRGTVQRSLGRLIGRQPNLDIFLQMAERVAAPSPVRSVVQRKRIRTVVLGSAGIKELDHAVAQAIPITAAKRYGIVYSWDNLSSKFNAFVPLHRLAVWNDYMKKTAIEQFGYREEQVAVVGVPQFDLYHDYAPERTRDEFLTSLDLSSDARYRLYVGVPRSICPWGSEYVRDILESDEDSFVVVRVHPQDGPESYALLKDHPRVRLFVPGHEAGENDRRRGFWMPRADESRRLAEQLYFADAVLSVASTVTLESLQLDRPTINLGYDSNEPNRVFAVRMERYYASDHFRQVTASGAVPLVRSRDELLEMLREMPSWFDSTKDARMKLRNRIDPYADGRAAERLARDILAFHRDDPSRHSAPCSIRPRRPRVIDAVCDS